MAEAADTLTDWSLTKVHHYLRVELGHTISRALYEMEQRRLAGQLLVRVQKYVDGKPEGHPSYLPTDKTNEFVYYQVWVHPRGLEWGDFRCTIAEQLIRALWPAPSAVQSSQNKPKAEGWQVSRVKQVLRELFPPEGRPPADKPVKTIHTDVNKIFEARESKPASYDTVARAMGRRRA